MPEFHLDSRSDLSPYQQLVQIDAPGNGLNVLIPQPGVWDVPQQTVSLTGHPATPPSAAPSQIDGPCFARATAGYRQAVAYLPANRFWPLQWTVFLVFAVLALGLCYQPVRRRIR